MIAEPPISIRPEQFLSHVSYVGILLEISFDKKNLLLENIGLLTPYQVLLVCLHHHHQPLPQLFSNFTETEAGSSSTMTAASVFPSLEKGQAILSNLRLAKAESQLKPGSSEPLPPGLLLVSLEEAPSPHPSHCSQT